MVMCFSPASDSAARAAAGSMDAAMLRVSRMGSSRLPSFIFSFLLNHL